MGGGGERQEAGWYEERGVTYRVNSKVTAVDAAAKTVALADGTTLPYDTLVVATGARSLDLAADFNVPGADAKGIHYLRNVADADALYAAIQAAADGPMKGVLATTDEALVSTDLNHIAASSTAALPQTQVVDGKLARVLTWYDNEWGFATRMADTALVMSKLI